MDLAVKDARSNEFDALMIPGGLFNPDGLRSDRNALEFAQPFFPGAQAGGGHLSWTAGPDQRGSCSRQKDDFVASNPGRYAQRRREVGR